MATESIETVLSPVTEPSLTDLVGLLLLDGDQLLSLAKSHLVTGVFPGLSIEGLKADPGRAVTMGFSLASFLRQHAAKPAGKQLAKLLRASTKDGGYDICKRLDYCNEKKTIQEKITKAQKAIGAKIVLDQIDDDLEENLREILGDEAYEILESILEYLADISQWIGENLEWLADLGAPILTPVSLTLFALIYALDDLCQCDEKPENRNWPKREDN